MTSREHEKAEKPVALTEVGEGEQHKAAEKMLANVGHKTYVDHLGQALSKMDRRMDNDKLNLSTDDLSRVKAIEKAVVKADSEALTKQLAELAKNPGEAQKLMDVASKDLAAVGVDARWSYTSKLSGPGFGPGHYLAGHEDVGHLAIARDNKDGTFTQVTFSTEGNAEGIRRPIPRLDGMASPLSDSPVDPAMGLREMANDALKHKS